MFRKFFILVLITFFLKSLFAETIIVSMHDVSAKANNQFVGKVAIQSSLYGLLFLPSLHSLPVGIHGFHIHEYPSCADQGMAAGGHFDPQNTGHHLGPYNAGHLGDLPVLSVDSSGVGSIPVLAPRLTSLLQIKGHALMIHSDGDTYSDTPQLGGGGMRMFCGVIN